MVRTMLFISISPKCSVRITIPWTALIYVPAPHPVANLSSSCRDTLIEWELKTGRQRVSACLFILLGFFMSLLLRQSFLCHCLYQFRGDLSCCLIEEEKTTKRKKKLNDDNLSFFFFTINLT